jgi:hypothetical protein
MDWQKKILMELEQVTGTDDDDDDDVQPYHHI